MKINARILRWLGASQPEQLWFKKRFPRQEVEYQLVRDTLFKEGLSQYADWLEDALECSEFYCDAPRYNAD